MASVTMSLLVSTRKSNYQSYHKKQQLGIKRCITCIIHFSFVFQVAACISMLANVSPAEAKPFNTNINTNYNSNYNANLNTNYLISSLLNYILDLLQIIHKNGQRSGPVDIPAFPQLHEIPLRTNTPATGSQSPLSTSMDVNKESTAVLKGDFNILDDYVFDNIIKNRKPGMGDDGLVVDESRKSIEAAVDAFRGPDVPALISPIPLDAWGLPLTVQEPPELQATKLELLRSFGEREPQARTG